MPTIKQLIDKTVREGSSFSLPSASNAIEFNPTGGDGTTSTTPAIYTPPSDGWISVTTGNSGSNTTIFSLQNPAGTRCGAYLYKAERVPECYFSIPVKKGTSVAIIWGTAQWHKCYFIPLLGKT